MIRAQSAVDALVAARRLGEAGDLARTVLTDDVTSARATAELQLTLSSIMLARGRIGAALAAAEAVLSDDRLPEPMYAAAHLARLLGLMGQGDGCRARESAEAILAGRHGPGAEAALAGALTALGFVAWEEGHVNDAIGFLHAAVQRADGGRPPAWRICPRLALAAVLTAIGEFEEAGTVVQECRDEIKRTAAIMWAPAADVVASRLHLAAGRLDDALAEAKVGLTIVEELDARFFAPMVLSVLATVALLAGDVVAAAAFVKGFRAELHDDGDGVFGPPCYWWVEARVLDAQVEPSRTVLAPMDRSGAIRTLKRLILEEPGAAAWLVRAAIAGDDRRRAETVVDVVDQLARENREFVSIVASACHARGLLDRDLAAIEHAVDGYRHPWATASATEDAGLLLAEGGALPSARARLELALVAYERMGAFHDAARVRARLDAVPFGLRSRRRADQLVSGVNSLTITERRVAYLVAEDLSNRQIADRIFLSRHTVDFHLRHVFRKLGISSRVELIFFRLEDPG